MKKILICIALSALCITIPSTIKANDYSEEYGNPITNEAEIKPSGINTTIKLKDGSSLTIDKAYVSDDITVNSENSFALYSTAFPIIGKTITITKSTPNFPKTTKYREYTLNDWYSGTLNFVSAKRSGNKYVATYSGILKREV